MKPACRRSDRGSGRSWHGPEGACRPVRSRSSTAAASCRGYRARDQVLVDAAAAKAGRLPRAEGVTVALDTSLDDELLLEGRVQT